MRHGLLRFFFEDPMPAVSSSSPQAQRLRDLIKDVKFAMLTTRAVDGTLTSRPMTTLQTEFDGTLWFMLSAHSLKAVDIEERPKVNLGYAEPHDGRYVSVSGVAEVVHDESKIRELWNPAYETWFPGGPDDPNLALLKVDIASADYWETPQGDPQRLYEALEHRDAEALGRQTHIDLTQPTAERSRPSGTC
jgi:general stress protein 26